MMPNRGHSLTIDHGWQEVAQTALDFVERFVPPKPASRLAWASGFGRRNIGHIHVRPEHTVSAWTPYQATLC
jgi:hypothetical protein